jgi:cob(I)alamin adenosyltransferase
MADATQSDRPMAGPRATIRKPDLPDSRVVTVNLTRIYTKLGDGGDTHLGDMSRVSKVHPRVEAYGTVDELNSVIGVALLAPELPAGFAEWLARVQNDLLDVGADLSVPSTPDDAPDAMRKSQTRLRVTSEYAQWLERVCDDVNAKLEPLRTFVIPGGTPAAAQLHVARTVCRRAERRAIAVGEQCNPEVIRYLNRLSDMLFILSRAANDGQTVQAESLWAPGAHGSNPVPESS